MDCTSKNVGPYRLCIRGVSQAMFRVRVPTQLLSLSGPTMPTTFSAVFYVPGSAPLCMNGKRRHSGIKVKTRNIRPTPSDATYPKACSSDITETITKGM
eukprot:scaffold112421_cov19-Tisochrysis_lutea.AAC.2